jgi:uncharacterized protein (DUF2141 family)
MRNYVIAFFVLMLFGMCANQTSPGGGPQDKKAPELLSTNPKSNQLNFKGKTIELAFDEYIKLKDPNEEIMITPSMGKDVKYIAKKNKLIVSPKQNWKDSTTYSISFRDGVQDISESNPAFNLRLAFSTGSEIDSLQLYGKVTELFKEEIPEKITVAIYQSDTFNVFNHQPTYFTRTDKKGRFSLNNLKAGDYHIYTFDDKNKNLKVESKTERYGFATKKIELQGKVDSISLSLIQVDARPIKITSTRNTQKISRIRFNKAIDSLTLKCEQKSYFIHTYGDKQDELILFGILEEQPEEDSLKIELHLKDSVGNVLDTTTYIKSVKVKTIKDKFKMSFSKLKYNIESKILSLEGDFNKPIKSLNKDSLYVQVDSLTFIPIVEKDISIDTLNHKLSLKKTIEFKKPEKDEPPLKPILYLGRGAFISIEQDSSQSKTENIKIDKEEELGSLAIEVNTQEKNYIIELITTNKEKVRTLYNPKKYVFKNLTPQEYKLRIIIDSNNNKKWDVGNLSQNIEPEKVILYRTFDKKTSTPVRANWEVGPLMIKF